MTYHRPHFISIPHLPSATPGDTSCNVVINSPSYWIDNDSDIEEWCDQNAAGWCRRNSLLTFPDECSRLAFMMRWGG